MISLRDELLSGPLAGEIAPLIENGDDGAIFALLNGKNIPAKKSISAHDVQQYLMLHDLLLTIESSQTATCLAAKRALEIFPVFDLSNLQVLAKFTQILNGLIADELIPAFTEQHKTELLAMGDTLISRAEQIGMVITEPDIRRELWNDDGSRRI